MTITKVFLCATSRRNTQPCQISKDKLCYKSACLGFNGHFTGGPGLASTRMSPFWILLELRIMEVVATTPVIRRAKLQSKCHYQQTNTQFLQAGCPSCRPANSVKAVKVHIYY